MADTAKRADDDDVLVQYVVMRRDLLDQMKWPVGSIIAQGAHGIDAIVQQATSSHVNPTNNVDESARSRCVNPVFLTACIAAISEDLHGKYVKEYLAGAMDNTMRKVVLEVKDEDRLLAIGCKLKQANISHRVWVFRFVYSFYQCMFHVAQLVHRAQVERPENISTCLACRPYPRSLIKPLFKGLRLFK